MVLATFVKSLLQKYFVANKNDQENMVLGGNRPGQLESLEAGDEKLFRPASARSCSSMQPLFHKTAGNFYPRENDMVVVEHDEPGSPESTHTVLPSEANNSRGSSADLQRNLYFLPQLAAPPKGRKANRDSAVEDQPAQASGQGFNWSTVLYDDAQEKLEQILRTESEAAEGKPETSNSEQINQTTAEAAAYSWLAEAEPDEVVREAAAAVLADPPPFYSPQHAEAVEILSEMGSAKSVHSKSTVRSQAYNWLAQNEGPLPATANIDEIIQAASPPPFYKSSASSGANSVSNSVANSTVLVVEEYEESTETEHKTTTHNACEVANLKSPTSLSAFNYEKHTRSKSPSVTSKGSTKKPPTGKQDPMIHLYESIVERVSDTDSNKIPASKTTSCPGATTTEYQNGTSTAATNNQERAPTSSPIQQQPLANDQLLSPPAWTSQRQRRQQSMTPASTIDETPAFQEDFSARNPRWLCCGKSAKRRVTVTLAISGATLGLLTLLACALVVYFLQYHNN